MAVDQRVSYSVVRIPAIIRQALVVNMVFDENKSINARTSGGIASPASEGARSDWVAPISSIPRDLIASDDCA